MHARSRFVVSAMLAAVGLVSGCSTKTCTLRGCQDQFRVSMGNADNTVPLGTHVVEVTADGAILSCTFVLAAEHFSPNGSPPLPECPSGLEVRIGAGRFFEVVTVFGKPAEVRVRVTVDGAVMIDRTERPRYEEDLPNGPGCDPFCHQFSAEWTFSPP